MTKASKQEIRAELERKYNIDIDTPEDWANAENKLKNVLR